MTMNIGSCRKLPKQQGKQQGREGWEPAGAEVREREAEGRAGVAAAGSARQGGCPTHLHRVHRLASGVSGVGTTATAGTTAFLMNKDGDEGMEGSPSFDGVRSAGAHTAAPRRPQTRRQISVSTRSDFGGEVGAYDV